MHSRKLLLRLMGGRGRLSRLLLEKRASATIDVNLGYWTESECMHAILFSFPPVYYHTFILVSTTNQNVLLICKFSGTEPLVA